MYLSELEYKELMCKIENVEHFASTVHKLDSLLQKRVLGEPDEGSMHDITEEFGEEDGLLSPESLLDIAYYDDFDDMQQWVADTYERISLDEFTTFLQLWVKIINDESWLESLITLGALLMRKEHKTITAEIKQVIDIRNKILQRERELTEFYS